MKNYKKKLGTATFWLYNCYLLPKLLFEGGVNVKTLLIFQVMID